MIYFPTKILKKGQSEPAPTSGLTWMDGALIGFSFLSLCYPKLTFFCLPFLRPDLSFFFLPLKLFPPTHLLTYLIYKFTTSIRLSVTEVLGGGGRGAGEAAGDLSATGNRFHFLINCCISLWTQFVCVSKERERSERESCCGRVEEAVVELWNNKTSPSPIPMQPNVEISSSVNLVSVNAVLIIAVSGKQIAFPSLYFFSWFRVVWPQHTRTPPWSSLQ